MSLPDFLQEQKIPAIVGVDTRAITRKLRQQGALGGCILIDGDAAEAKRRAKEFSDCRARVWQPNQAAKSPDRQQTGIGKRIRTVMPLLN